LRETARMHSFHFLHPFIHCTLTCSGNCYEYFVISMVKTLSAIVRLLVQIA
jgi:hypothetical protein